MSDIKVSVIVATYAPGDAITRLIDSLDRQTLPADEFEVIFVDDGSPDDTPARLRSLAETRPNFSIYEIENSGWPSRPRNIGIQHARGEYVMFVDHDDSLYPDGLRRAYDFAHENGADILSPKESKTNDAWWGLSSLTSGNISNILEEERVHRLLPMVPHKLYRRTLLMEHEVRFPERPRALWEDWYINVGAYRHASVVSVLADTTVYLWHGSDTNSSHTFDPAREDFWDRLDDMLEYVSSTLDVPGYEVDRKFLVAYNLGMRAIDRCARLLVGNAEQAIKERALYRSAALLERYCTSEIFDLMSKKHRAFAVLIKSKNQQAVADFQRADLAGDAEVGLSVIGWSGSVLQVQVETKWGPKNPSLPILSVENGALLRVVPDTVRAALPVELLEVGQDARDLVVEFGVRARSEHVTWQTPYQGGSVSFAPDSSGTVALTQRGVMHIDIDTCKVGDPLDDFVWDVRARVAWAGMERRRVPLTAGPARPALVNGRAAVAYANQTGGLTLDLGEKLRTLATDAKPLGQAGPITSFMAPLKNIAVVGSRSREASLFAVDSSALATGRPDQIEGLAVAVDLSAQVVPAGSGAYLVGGADLRPGEYSVFARRAGKMQQTKLKILVDHDGRASFQA